MKQTRNSEMNKDELLLEITRIQHSVDRLERLVKVNAPPLVIERERLICLRRLNKIAPDDAEITRQAEASFTEK